MRGLVQARRGKWLVFDLKLDGDYERVLFAEKLDVYMDFIRKIRQSTHGMCITDRKPDFKLDKSHSWLLIAKDPAGEIVGVMQYDLKGDGTPGQFTMNIPRFYYHNQLTL